MPLVDFAVLTALAEEFTYLRQLFPDMREVVEPSGTWYRTSITAKNRTRYEAVLAYQDQMGPLDAQGLMVRTLERWDPAYVLLVGIAGQFDSSLALGDVIVGQQIFYFDPQEITDTRVMYRPAGYPAGVSLIRQVHAVSVSPDELGAWRAEAAASAARKANHVRLASVTDAAEVRRALQAHVPSIHVGTVASGSDVVKSEARKQELLQLHGKILGIEMEGCGIMHAAFFHRETPTQALLIKGISDKANADKAKLDAFPAWRELACENAARLALAVMSRGGLRPQLTDEVNLDTTTAAVDVTRQRIVGPLRAGFSPIGFPRLVVPMGPITALTISVRAERGGHELPLRQRIVEFSRGGTRQRDQWRPQTPVEFRTEQPLDPDAIAVFLLIEGAPDRIVFDVTTPGTSVATEWQPRGVQPDA